MDDKWFKEQQKRVGATADDIAKKMGRTRANVSNIYTGRQRMSLEWAQAFSDVLQVPIDEVLKRAGALDQDRARPLAPGFAESDVIPWKGEGKSAIDIQAIAGPLGGSRPGVDVWEIKSAALAFMGYMPGDFMLVDAHAAERCVSGDVVIAQKYKAQNHSATTLLRRFEAPVLVAASPEPDDRRVEFVDGSNVVIRGRVIASWRV